MLDNDLHFPQRGGVRGHLASVPPGVLYMFSFISEDRRDVWTRLSDLLQLVKIRFSHSSSPDLSQNV